MPLDEDGVVRDVSDFDWGARFRPDYSKVPIGAHLGGNPNLGLFDNPEYPKEDLNPRAAKAAANIDASKLVVPPANVPEPAKVDALVDKVLTDKEQKELFNEKDLHDKNSL